jgi:hypothetical protein
MLAQEVIPSNLNKIQNQGLGMKRRSFIQQGILSAGAMMFLPSLIHGSVNPTLNQAKHSIPGAFLIGYLGTEQEYLKNILPLSGLITGTLVRINSKKAVRSKLNAVFVAASCRKPEKNIRFLLKNNIAVLWEYPFSKKQVKLEKLIAHPNDKHSPLKEYLPLSYLPAILKLKEIIKQGSLGTIQSVKLQIDALGSDYPSKDECAQFPLIIKLLKLVGSCTEEKLLSVEVKRPGSQMQKSYPHSFFFSVETKNLKIMGSTIPMYFEKSSGWSIRFTGTQGQALVNQNGSLEIFDPHAGKSSLVPSKETDQMLATRLTFESFINTCKQAPLTITDTTELVLNVNLMDAMKKSLASGIDCKIEPNTQIESHSVHP